MQKFLLFLILITGNTPVFANSQLHILDETEDNVIPISELLHRETDNTQCATQIFATALMHNLRNVAEDVDETVIQGIIYNTFSQSDVLTNVLECPELQSIQEEETIKFMPIEYVFPQGRKVSVNYETQPKILKQHLLMSQKRDLPTNSTNPSPRVGDPLDPTIWTNTDPAWYGILVVEQGTLDDFVGPDKNNTISLKYIEENIEKLRPQGTCTNESALAYDDRNLNLAVHETVGLGDQDTNDYYVAGDVNLQWISYAEIALDVVITITTFGVGTAISGATKTVQATRAMRNLTKTIRVLQKSDKVTDYIRLGNKIAHAKQELKAVQAFQQIAKIRDTIRGLDKVKDAKKIAKYEKEIKELEKSTIGFRDATNLRDANKLEQEITEGNKTLQHMRKTDSDVAKYEEATTAFENLNKYRHSLRGLRSPQRGNIVAKTLKYIKAATRGGKKELAAATKMGRSSTLSGRIRDKLFISTLKSVDALGKLERQGGLLYGTLRFVGDMYDWTETSTGEFSNGIEFKPLGLLSADDIPGQDNVVNYGMWLMWQGDSISPADDDAAYLQAMDFSDKFYNDLQNIQSKNNNYTCNIDIYVVRPIIREPGSANPEMYYLIMNDEPWRTKH